MRYVHTEINSVFDEINKDWETVPDEHTNPTRERLSKMRYHVHGEIWMINFAVMEAVGPFFTR